MKAIAILDNDGRRILANYYDKTLFPTIKEEKAFEKNLFQKTHKANADIIMLDGLTCLYRSNVDLFFYVMGDCHENEVRRKKYRLQKLADRTPCYSTDLKKSASSLKKQSPNFPSVRSSSFSSLC